MDRKATVMKLVTAQELEDQLGVVKAQARGPLEGVFGHDSMEWRLNGEAAVFLGAGRALLLQLAHPFVAAAVYEHSRVFADPIGRFHRTFQVVFTMVFGTIEQAVTAARRLHQRHASVCGKLPEAVGPFAKDTPYAANDSETLRWVHATLAETALLAHNLVLPAFTQKKIATYYAESRVLASLFGIPRHMLPPNWNAFETYNREMLDSSVLTVSAEARKVARQVISGTGRIVPNWYWALTGQLLPERLRKEFGLDPGVNATRIANLAIAQLKRLYPFLPWRLRHVGPFQEAHARLSGKRPDVLTKLVNRIWIGRRFLQAPG
jgi:uncharacterized protein (DUF2236 family)